MTAQLDSDSVTAQIAATTKAARKAQKSLAAASRTTRDAALEAMAVAIDTHRNDILQANATDLQRGKDNNIAAALLDRLELNDARIDGLMSALQELAALPEPIRHVVRVNNLTHGIRMHIILITLGIFDD